MVVSAICVQYWFWRAVAMRASSRTLSSESSLFGRPMIVASFWGVLGFRGSAGVLEAGGDSASQLGGQRAVSVSSQAQELVALIFVDDSGDDRLAGCGALSP